MSDRKIALREGVTTGSATSANAAAHPDTAAILRMLGLAKRAGRLAVGTDATIKAVRSAKSVARVAPDASGRAHNAADCGAACTVPLAIVASDASERTKKQLSDKCAAYGVTLVGIEADRAALAAALGAKDGQTSACAVTDRNMAIKIYSLINT